jgi:15-cis-phytoene synthase
VAENNPYIAAPNATPDTVRNVARSGAPDRYLAALLAPRPVRDNLIALAAYAAEIEKIPQLVSDPHIGEIRIQWWRDALLAPQRGSTGNPVADAFAETMQRHKLPVERIAAHLDAAVHALYADAPANDEQLSLSLEMNEGTLFALAAHILGAPQFNTTRDIGLAGTQACGLTKIALSLPYALAHGRNPLPPSLAPNSDQPDWQQSIAALVAKARLQLAQVRAAYPAEQAAIKTALLPVALVEPYLRALSQRSHDPARDLAEIAPLTRAWRLVKTHVRGRI